LEGGGAPSGDWRGRSKTPLGRKGLEGGGAPSGDKRGRSKTPLDRGWKGAEPSLVIREGGSRSTWATCFYTTLIPFYIAYLNTTVLFNGSNGTAYTRPSRVWNSYSVTKLSNYFLFVINSNVFITF
jgi:hypothetical protein